MNSIVNDDIPTNEDNEIPLKSEHPTYPNDLRPSLPPDAVTFADILASHQAILGELESFRVDLENFKRFISDKPSWVTEFMNSAAGLANRVENLEVRLQKQESFCKYKHPDGNNIDIAVNE